MLKKYLRIGKCCYFVIVTVFFISVCSCITRPVNTDSTHAVIRAFHDQPENSFDVIGYGSSHMWRGFDPSVLNEKYGLKAFNYGGNWQHINTTRLFMEDSFKTQNPKVALIDTYRAHSLLKNVDLDGEIYYTRYLGNSSTKLEYLRQCFGNHIYRYLEYYFPFAVFHNNWKNIEEDSFHSIDSRVEKLKASYGYVRMEGADEIELLEPEEEEELPDDAVEELDKIVEACRQRNIKIVFYTAPYKGPYLYGHAMQKYAAENQCFYINLFDHLDEIGINVKEDFHDNGHLNNSGAQKVTDYLGSFLTTEVLPD